MRNEIKHEVVIPATYDDSTNSSFIIPENQIASEECLAQLNSYIFNKDMINDNANASSFIFISTRRYELGLKK